MPSLSKSPIKDQDLTSFRSKGFCVIEGILNKAECQKYLEAADAAAQDQKVKYAPFMNPDRQYPVFFELLANKLIVSCLESLLKSKVHALQSMLYYKPPGALGRDLHQDNFYARASDPEAYVGTWLPLEDSDRENGGLLVYPGSHREPLLEINIDPTRQQTNVGDFRNDRGTSCLVPEGYEKNYLSTPAGSAVLIHGHLIHGSEENLSKTRFRRVFAGHYIKQGSNFRPGEHADRKIIDVYS